MNFRFGCNLDLAYLIPHFVSNTCILPIARTSLTLACLKLRSRFGLAHVTTRLRSFSLPY